MRMEFGGLASFSMNFVIEVLCEEKPSRRQLRNARGVLFSRSNRRNRDRHVESPGREAIEVHGAERIRAARIDSKSGVNGSRKRDLGPADLMPGLHSGRGV